MELRYEFHFDRTDSGGGKPRYWGGGGGVVRVGCGKNPKIQDVCNFGLYPAVKIKAL